MKDKNIYLLVYKTTNFYDGHGEPDFGGSTKELAIIKDGDWSSNGEYIQDCECEGLKPLVPGVTYNDDNEPEEFDEREYGAEDSYNCEVTLKSIKIITKEQYDEYAKILMAYDSL